MRANLGSLRDLPLTTRFACIGATVAGAIGAATGLVVGVYAYPPTAPFAVVEVGIPATIAGGGVGLMVGAIARLARQIRRRDTRPRQVDG